ncbi:unnamed protein product [Cuscuta epithymum]|uniref:Uncharacterized protein n=1 Tax=Cuscuta epithymum TaxID=186058 RepID=A0AAV0EDR6_9ASTE|nr:unnamed protein product [Cuscuta epithymum]
MEVSLNQIIESLQPRLNNIKKDEFEINKEALEAVNVPANHVQLFGLLTSVVSLISDKGSTSVLVVMGMLTVAFFIGMILPFFMAYRLITKLESLAKNLNRRYGVLHEEIRKVLAAHDSTLQHKQSTEVDIEKGVPGEPGTSGEITSEQTERTEETAGNSEEASKYEAMLLLLELENETENGKTEAANFKRYYIKMLSMQGLTAVIYVFSIPLVGYLIWKGLWEGSTLLRLWHGYAAT